MLGRLLRWFIGDAPDPAATMQTWRKPTAAYDERKAVAGRLRALERQRQRRRLEDASARGARVEPFRKVRG